MAVIRKRFTVSSEADLVKARAAVSEMAGAMGFNKHNIMDVETVVSDLGYDLMKGDARNGGITLTLTEEEDGREVEIVSSHEDSGTVCPRNAMRGGPSGEGAPWMACPGERRPNDDSLLPAVTGFEAGTTAKKWIYYKKCGYPGFSVVTRPKPGQVVSGDAHLIRCSSGSVFFYVIDALGHGEEAHETAEAAGRVIDGLCSEPLSDIVEVCHRRLKGSRGVVFALCRIDLRRKVREHLGIGNIEVKAYGSPECGGIFSYNGTIGMRIENYKTNEYPYTDGSVIVMSSDGISRRFDFDSYLSWASPHEIAAHVFKRYAREHDDATVLVCK